MSKNSKISGLLVVHNEEAMLPDALVSLSFCDELVVVLDKCTDGSKGITEGFVPEKGVVKILEGSWEIEGERRNLGIEACTGDWIFELDADERISKELAFEIRERVEALDEHQGYFLVPIDNYIGDHLVKNGWAGSFGTTRAKKLFAKGCKRWGAQRVHPKVDMHGPAYSLEHPLVHLIDKDINDMIDRLQRYSDAAAADLRAGGDLPTFRTSLRKGLTRFYKSYIARKGYKEGRYGFLLALMAGLFPVLSHLKAELEES